MNEHTPSDSGLMERPRRAEEILAENIKNVQIKGVSLRQLIFDSFPFVTEQYPALTASDYTKISFSGGSPMSFRESGKGNCFYVTANLEPRRSDFEGLDRTIAKGLTINFDSALRGRLRNFRQQAAELFWSGVSLEMVVTLTLVEVRREITEKEAEMDERAVELKAEDWTDEDIKKDAEHNQFRLDCLKSLESLLIKNEVNGFEVLSSGGILVIFPEKP